MDESIKEDRAGAQDMMECSCPGCGSGFVCMVADIANCQCSSVFLSEKTRKTLSGTAKECMCRSCLENEELKINAAENPNTEPEKPSPEASPLYYMEGKYYVFTELYHRQRGYCCKNNCRHCPYGFHT